MISNHYKVPLEYPSVQQYVSESIAALSSCGMLQADEVEQVEQLYRENFDTKPRQYDILECVALSRNNELGSRNFSGLLRDMSYITATAVYPTPIVLPFVEKLAPPNTFYEQHPEIGALAKVLLCPIIYCEDNESFGLISINPVATAILKDALCDYFKRKSGSIPYVSQFRADSPAWNNLLSKHFSYDRI